MTSQKQIVANRRNAQKSTGPKTLEGKRNSSRNAVKHGLTAERVIIEGEDPKAFNTMRAALFAELTPNSTLETQLVDRLASILWRLRRIPEIEASLLEAHRLDVEYDAAAMALRQCDADRHKVREELYDRTQTTGLASQLNTRPPDMSQLDAEYGQRRDQLERAATARLNANAMLGWAFRKSLVDFQTLEKLPRYEQGLVRMYESTLRHLEQAKEKFPPDTSDIIDMEPVSDEA